MSTTSRVNSRAGPPTGDAAVERAISAGFWRIRRWRQTRGSIRFAIGPTSPLVLGRAKQELATRIVGHYQRRR